MNSKKPTVLEQVEAATGVEKTDEERSQTARTQMEYTLSEKPVGVCAHRKLAYAARCPNCGFQKL